MIKKQIFSAVLVLALTACLFSGCLGDDKIVGTWKGEEKGMTITFNEDGTYLIDPDINGSWEKSKGEYIIYNAKKEKIATAEIKSNKLTINPTSSSLPYDTFVKV